MIIRKVFSFSFHSIVCRSLFALFFLLLHVEKSDKSCFCSCLNRRIWCSDLFCDLVSLVLSVLLWMSSSLPLLLMWFAQFRGNSKSESQFYWLEVTKAAAAVKKALCHLTQPIELTPCSLHFLHRAFHQPWLINGIKPLITSKCNFSRLPFEWSLHFCVESSTLRRWNLYPIRKNEDEKEWKKNQDEGKIPIQFQRHQNWTIQFLALFQSFVSLPNDLNSYAMNM